jgi:hypothetical protein
MVVLLDETISERLDEMPGSGGVRRLRPQYRLAAIANCLRKSACLPAPAISVNSP